MSKSRSDEKPVLGITPGEPAGIGPDICLLGHASASQFTDPIYIVDPALLKSRASALGFGVHINDLSEAGFRADAMNVFPVPMAEPALAGTSSTRNAEYVIQTLEQAVLLCQSERIKAMVTGPVNKAVIMEAGIPFSGHTEWLAERTGTGRVVMMLIGSGLRVALATTHLPLSEVPAAINREMLEETIRITMKDLSKKFGIRSPSLVVCGLNPHAGEGGHLGREELDIIIPTLEALRSEGMNLTGPLPADTAFTPRSLEHADAVLAMYHDQGLPVLKYAAFGDAVNITLGLPIIRTSVDHGTAFDLAGTGRADPASLLAAIRCAADMTTRN